MKTYQIAAAALSLFTVFAVQAETYDGVQQSTSVRSSDEVRSEAVRAAAAANQNIPRGSRGAESFTPQADREAIRAQAIAAANAPDQNVSSGSRVNSRVISNMPPRTQSAGVNAQGAVSK